MKTTTKEIARMFREATLQVIEKENISMKTAIRVLIRRLGGKIAYYSGVYAKSSEQFKLTEEGFIVCVPDTASSRFNVYALKGLARFLFFKNYEDLTEIQEKRTWIFASEFLMPDKELKDYLDGVEVVSESTIDELAKKFGVVRDFVRHKLITLGSD